MNIKFFRLILFTPILLLLIVACGNDGPNLTEKEVDTIVQAYMKDCLNGYHTLYLRESNPDNLPFLAHPNILIRPTLQKWDYKYNSTDHTWSATLSFPEGKTTTSTSTMSTEEAAFLQKPWELTINDEKASPEEAIVRSHQEKVKGEGVVYGVFRYYVC